MDYFPLSLHWMSNVLVRPNFNSIAFVCYTRWYHCAFFWPEEILYPLPWCFIAWKSKLWGSDNRSSDWLLSARGWLKMCVCMLLHSLSSWMENETAQSLLCKCMDLGFFPCLNLCVAVCRQTSSPALFWRCCVKKRVSLFWPLRSDPVSSSIPDITSLQKPIASH